MKVFKVNGRVEGLCFLRGWSESKGNSKFISIDKSKLKCFICIKTGHFKGLSQESQGKLGSDCSYLKLG